MTEDARPSRFRLRIRTALLVVAILALLLVVVVQQVQMGRLIDAHGKEKDQLTAIIRELRDHLARHR